MKKKRIFGASVLALSVALASVAAVGANTKIEEAAEAWFGNYYININADKNQLGTFDVANGSTTVRSESGADIEFALNLVGYPYIDGWLEIGSTQSYVANTDIIHGLINFTATFNYEGLILYWSDNPIDFNNLSGVSNVALVSGTTHSFGGDYPNYILIANSTGISTIIESVSICYNCRLDTRNYGSYPQTALGDDDPLRATLETLTPDSDGFVTASDGTRYLKALGSGNNHWFNQATNSWVVFDPEKYYYFKVEPIVWDVKSDGTFISDRVIDSYVYHTSNSDRSYGGRTVSANNYEYSTVRAYLNGYDGTQYGVADYSKTERNFKDIAFTEEEWNAINPSDVDNSAATTNSSDNSFAGTYTRDKIYLLSYQEAQNANYGFGTDTGMNDGRKKTVTDYAAFRGGTYFSDKTAWWWTRSPDGGVAARPTSVNAFGMIVNGDYASTVLGLVPAFKLPEY